MAEFEHPKANAEIVPHGRPFISQIPKLRKIIAARGLTGLANDTKWNELIAAMRNIPIKSWCSSFRYKCIDSDFVSQWDGEWWHDLPFPFISVMWLELSFLEKIHRGRLLTPDVIVHPADVEALLSSIGFDFEMGCKAFRIFGYSPRDRDDFASLPKAGVPPNSRPPSQLPSSSEVQSSDPQRRPSSGGCG